MTRVAIVGGGISGLAVGFELISRGLAKEDLVILESADRTGGNIETVQSAGFTMETGPNGFLDNSPPSNPVPQSPAMIKKTFSITGARAGHEK